MGLWTRQHAGRDTRGASLTRTRGVQYLAVRYTQRLAEAGAVASVGSTGDSHDSALAEALNSLFKAELVRNKGPWKSIDDLEIAVAEYIDWCNQKRLHGEIGLVPPLEFEEQHHRQHPAPAAVEASVPSLHETRHGTLAHASVGLVGTGAVGSGRRPAAGWTKLVCVLPPRHRAGSERVGPPSDSVSETRLVR